MTEKEKMLKELLYIPGKDSELKKDFQKARKLTRLFNLTTENDLDYRKELLNKLLKKTGENFYIEPPFRCDYGSNISIGENFYANFDCIILDVCDVTIGHNVLFAPRVNIFTAAHPIDKDIRNEGLEYGKKVTIGNDVWIGGNTTINPGVKIGNNVIVGSGSVVTKDIPSNVIAAGNPCKIIRDITESDKIYWENLKSQYYNS